MDRLFYVRSTKTNAYEILKEIIEKSLRTDPLLNEMLNDFDLDDALDMFASDLFYASGITIDCKI